MHATRPTRETHLRLMRPTEINLSFSTTWMQDKDLCVDEDHSAYRYLVVTSQTCLSLLATSSCSP